MCSTRYTLSHAPSIYRASLTRRTLVLTRVRASRAHKEVLSSAVRCVASARWTRKALRARKATRSLDIRRKSRSTLRTAYDGVQQYQQVSLLACGVHPLGRRQVPVITCGAFHL